MASIVITSKKALREADKHRKFLAELKAKQEEHKNRIHGESSEPDIHHFLVAKGEPSTFTHRKKLAQQLGMKDYFGMSQENTHLLKLLKLKEGYQKENPQKEPSAIEEYLKLLD